METCPVKCRPTDKTGPFSTAGFRVFLVMLKKGGKAKVMFTAIHWHKNS